MHHTANTYPFPFIYFERIRFTCKRHIKYGLRTASKNRIKKMARKNKYDLMQKAKENHILVLEHGKNEPFYEYYLKCHNV